MSTIDLVQIGKIFAAGVVDSVSYHRAIPILSDKPKATYVLLQIVAVNIVLLVGSLFVYERGIKAGLRVANEKWNVLPPSENEVVMFAAYTVYHIFWIVPIYFLCYGCSLTWYKDLSVHLIKASPKPLTDSMKDSIYGTLLWLFIWLETQIFYAWIPSILGGMIVHNPKTNVASFIVSILISLRFSSLVIGFGLSCMLYGWYAFDQRWISEGCDADIRVSQIENNIIYFIGFGLPYVLLFRFVPFFVAYGLYLSIFPFSMIMGCISNYHYSIPNLPKIKVFAYARSLTGKTLQKFRGKAKENLKMQTTSSKNKDE